MRKLGSGAVAVAAMFSAALPLQAQDSPAPSPEQVETQKVKDRTELIKAETDKFKAETDRLKAQIDALGLPKPEGKTELEGEAGKLEGWMLASATLGVAAARIDTEVQTWLAGNNAAGPIILLDADDILDLRVGELLRAEIQSQTDAYDSAMIKAKCSNAPVRGAAAAAIIPAIGTILSLLKTDTKMSGFSFDTAEGALINALAGQGGGRYVIPADLAAPGAGGTTLAKLTAFTGLRDAAETCRIEIEAAAGDDAKAKKAAAVRLAPLVVLAARSQTWLDAASERKDGKPSRIELAMTADTLLASSPSPYILRLRVEKAGGSLLQRSNLFTMLGAPAVGITGGTVVSWRMSTASDGITRTGGILVCRTKLTNLNAIHAGRVDVNASSCGESMAAAPAAAQPSPSHQQAEE